ncbi:two-component sensor histidine kinase [Pedobacter polaris]|uniref:Oxygen sensor histidine kinase NreB n=1 Tax=Pedobacter polaris TaxID=2571273 RepID=A0A4U1CHX2_9SPHI|nr:ATP-binding protein [Pedobacter polaris]TKC05560.1 two-component sensor histidine kinase [Pedobacter polaris]
MGQTEYLLVIILFNVFLVAFIVAVISFVVQYKNKKKESVNQLQQQHVLHQKELLATQIEIQTQTMQHIGREIHDNVGQKLTLASLYTQQLVFENEALPINDKITGIGELINDALSELRHLSKSLTDDHIDTNDISILLKEEFAKIKVLKKYKLNLTVNFESVLLNYQTKSLLLRIVQEFIQNSIKHASCKTISTSLVKNDNQLTLTLSDDGKGFNTEKLISKGIGLINIKKRIALIGGSYHMLSKEGNGTKLTIEISI